MTDKREQILEAAEELFAAKGFEGTSIRELARKAKINIAMVSYYFGSKENLLTALVEHRASVLFEKLALLNRDEKHDPFKKVEMAIHYYVDRIFSNPCFHKILHRELMLKQRSDLHVPISEILFRNANEVRTLIREGERKGVFKKVDEDLIIASVIGTITQVTLSETMSRKLLKITDGDVFSERTKKRLKKYLNDLIRSYLSK
jgi:AcrR family transcriptional regulator